MTSRNTISAAELPKGGDDKLNVNQPKNDDEIEVPRAESGVFISPQTSRDPDSCVTIPAAGARTQLDSGYRSGLSESSLAASDLSTSVHGVSPRMANFFLATEEGEEEEEILEGDIGVLLDSSATFTAAADANDDDVDPDDCELSGVSVQTLCPSPAVEIPCAATFHNEYGTALSLMQATPPRSYMSHPPNQDCQRNRQRYSTGCLTQLSPVIVKLLEGRSDTYVGQCLERGVRVTSGRLHASSSSADLCVRRTSDAVPLPPDFRPLHPCDDDSRPPIRRDRSASAPDIGAIVIQKKCAEELRKISDEFFAEVHKKGRGSFRTRGRRTQSVSHPPLDEDDEDIPEDRPIPRCNARRRGSEGGLGAGSYPGALRRNSEHSSWWWQAIIQNMAPSAVRRKSEAYQQIVMC